MFKFIEINSKMDLPVSVIILVLCCGMLIFAQDNGLQIEFQRILEAGDGQSIDQIQIDSSSTDTFQVMCRVNNVNQLFKIFTLTVQYKASANAQDFTDLAVLQNIDDTNADTYRKPVLASGTGSGWTAEGSFDTTSSNGRDSTLGVSRPVSSITCSNAVEYRCHLTYTKPGPDYSTAIGMKSKELDVKDANGLEINFQRKIGDGESANIEQIQVDSSSTDKFQVMCSVNNVDQLFRIGTLKIQYKASANAPDFTDLAVLQNVDDTNANTYRKPVLVSGAGSSWTIEGSYDTTNSNGRDSTLGVSRPVSSITCSNAVEYRCDLVYAKPAPGYNSGTGIISKELDVQVLPTTIARQVYNMSGMGSFPITFVDTIEPFYVGQTVKMECSANIGSYNGTAQIRWLKSNIVPGSPLAPYYSPDAVLGDLQSTGNCVYQQTDSVTYNMTAQDAARTAENRLHFQCYVYIPSMNWETPEDHRQNFKFIVYSRGKTSHDDTNDTDFDKESSSTGTVTGGVFGGVVGGVVVVAAVVVAVLIISRRYQFPCMQTSDNARNTKIQANPVFETQAASPYEHLATREQTEYTEIGMTTVGQSGAGSPNSETSSYERLHARENAAYTELGVDSPERQRQVESQQTDLHTASSNYEVPDNQESSKEQKVYENETNPKPFQASSYDYV